MHAVLGQPALRVDRGLTAHAARGDRLAVARVGDIARREHALDVRVARARLERHIALVVELEPRALQELRRGRVTDRDKEAAHRQRRPLLRHDILKEHAFDEVLAEDIDHHRVPHGLGLGVVEDARLHRLRRAERVAAMDHIHLRCELREIARLLHRRVAAADDRERLVAVHGKRAVADRARADAAAVHGEADLVRQADPVRGGAGRDDDRVRANRLALARLEHERPLREVAAHHIRVGDARTEAFRLLAEEVHHLGARDPVREARIVLDLGREHQLSARKHRRGVRRGDADDRARREVRARAVDAGGPSGRTRPDHDEFLDASVGSAL